MNNSINKKIISILKRYGIKKAGVFGSYARGDETNESDIDILIELPPKKKFNLFDLAGLELELEEKTGKPIQITTYNSLYYLIKDKILKEEKRIL